MTILVTGGAGFIGSTLSRHLIGAGHRVVAVDSLTYAGDIRSLAPVISHSRFLFYKADILDRQTMSEILHTEQVSAIFHLAAESHVDRSISGPDAFVYTNVLGTCGLLEVALAHWNTLGEKQRARFRFVHVSTDEVFGDLPLGGGCFDTSSAYNPRSPYAATKAAADHLCRAWFHTYGLPVIVTNCSNNYGAYHHPEKLIPKAITQMLSGQIVPVYGTGENVRDWLHVRDHVKGLALVLEKGIAGETYMFGGRAERSNLQVITAIADALDRLHPTRRGRSHVELVRHVADRKGHDRRYAVDPSLAERHLGWGAHVSFDEGLRETIDWYINNRWWWKHKIEVQKTTETVPEKELA